MDLTDIGASIRIAFTYFTILYLTGLGGLTGVGGTGGVVVIPCCYKDHLNI